MPKRYKVVGTAPILGNEPGETFTAKISDEQEAFLIQIGGLKVVGGTKKADKKD